MTSPESDTASPDFEEIWRRVQGEIGRALPGPTYQLWIEPVRAVAASGERLLLAAPAPVRSWVERRYADRVTGALRAVAPELREFKFVNEGRDLDEAESSQAPAPRLAFGDFVLGPSNRLAHAAALRVAEDPGVAYNPFYVWGPPGTGKTHLLAALANYAAELNPGLRARYMSSEEFTEEFVAAVRGPGTARLRERLRRLDLLIVDDAHYLGGRVKTQQELVHTFDALLARGAQIVIASEQAPTRIEGLSASLCDRFDSGLSVEVTTPDLPTRIAVVAKMVGQGRFPAPDQETLRRIAELAPANFRRLEAALTKVLAHSSLLGRVPTPELADDALGSGSLSPQAGPASSASRVAEGGAVGSGEIIAAVCRAQHVSAEELRSRRRSPELIHARRVAMYLSREAGVPLTEIGRAFGRDHSTVISALRTVERNLEPGGDLHIALDRARRELDSPAQSSS